MVSQIIVKRLEPSEWRSVHSIVFQLRNLDEDEFIRRVQRQTYSGYELVGAFAEERLVGVMGIRPVHTLARGPHLHVDDIVVDSSFQTTGVGRALMNFAENEARSREMGTVFLDARQDAIPFYERLGFVFHTSPSMKKIVA